MLLNIINQGYHLFFDNFYTSVHLLKELLRKGLLACGTIIKNRRGFPECLKNVKTFEKNSDRGAVRWMRTDDIVTVQGE